MGVIRADMASCDSYPGDVDRRGGAGCGVALVGCRGHPVQRVLATVSRGEMLGTERMAQCGMPAECHYGSRLSRLLDEGGGL